ncbi:queuosine precursor transporter [Legionella septentrionalis]|uniref:queuosine precursor transporter n=1 Tax=Legionella septentrionalis TaxID=2498109 RepID=UPI000F8D8143|nr:queuosine precursor transporter [Legionella septentrionalis]RUQ96641.1 VUT family protein [Legionella septentrionalis]
MITSDADKVPLQFRYFHFIAAFFVLSFIISNLLASKIANLGFFDFPAGMVTFPLSYIFSDILTEVYGFQRARQLLWFTIFCEFMVFIAISAAVSLPSASFWDGQKDYQNVLLPQFNIILASCLAYFLGDFVNSKFLSKQKLKHGNNLITARFIGSTALGVLVDNSVFTLLAYGPLFFSNNIPFNFMVWLIVSQYVIKVSYETLMSPLSVKFSKWLKQKEKVDIYDVNTNFSIFKIAVDETQHSNKFYLD